MAGSDFWNDFLKRLGIGIGLGLSIMMGITAVFLPASYMMNKLIYHHPFMRFITGLIAGILSILAFIVLIIMRLTSSVPQIHYFGLFPVVDIPGQGSYTGWLAILFTIFSYIFHPFITFYSGSDEDKAGYREAVGGLLVKGELTEEFAGQKFAKGAVCEAFFEKARAVGAIKDSTWANAINDLTETGKKMFNSDAVSSAPGSSKAHDILRTSETRPMVQQPLTEGKSYEAFIDNNWTDVGVFDHSGQSYGFHDQDNNYYFTKDGRHTTSISRDTKFRPTN